MKIIYKFIKILSILCMILYFSTISIYANTIEEYKGISILYTDEFNNDIDYTYQVISSTDINIREGPGIKYKIYGVFKEGDFIDNIVSEEYPDNKWIKIWYDMDYYYIYDDYLKVIKRSIYN